MKAEQQLPSLGEIARQCGVASMTVKRAFDDLVKEGWLRTQHGLGTFVRVRKDAFQIVLTAASHAGWMPYLAAEFLDAFHASHPNVRVILSSEPTTDFVVTDSYGLVVDRIRHHRLQSLDVLRDRFGSRDWELPAPVRAMASWNGALFGLPMHVTLKLLQLNPEFLQRCGVRPPDRFLDWTTYQKILTRCRQDQDGDGVAECFGSFSALDLWEWLVPFWQNGGRLDDQAAFFAAKPFSILDGLWRMHHVQQTLPIEMRIGIGEFFDKQIRRRFENGQIAIRWSDNIGISRRFPFSTGIVLPRFGSVPRQHAHAMLLGIHRDCAHPDAAMEFLNFCHQRFIRDNPEYPFALNDDDRRLLRQMPGLHRLLAEGFESASEPLHEGAPERTWAIENEIYDWFRLFVDRKTMLARLHAHWDRWATPSGPRKADGPALIISGESVERETLESFDARRPASGHPHSAFTLIELLVVVAIISVLASMLLPSLNKAKESARRIGCMNNVKQLITAVHVYAGDYQGLLPYGGVGVGSYWYQFNSLSDPGNPKPHGLGLLLYHGYLSNGRPYFCPSEYPGVDPNTKYSRYQQYVAYYGVGDNRDGFQYLLNNVGSIDFLSAYCYRGIMAWGPYFDAANPPAHGPDPNSTTWVQPYTRLDVNRCGSGLCGSYHPVFALISDSFLFDLVTGPMLPQGRFHHVVGYHVAYSDAHVRFAGDPQKVISGQLPASWAGGNTLYLRLHTEDIWNAFDSYSGHQNTAWVWGVPKE
ncbi:MAG: GntR family transcriptional regulator [Verrucomicrobia bacterium]|nr:GntR family transcriptional regulator [Verrucomicrobiota bacterium]